MSKQALFFFAFLFFFVSVINGQGQIEASNPVSKSRLLSRQRTHIVISKGATIHISKTANLVSASDIILEGDIIGEGKLVIDAQRKVSIDANNHEITNLVIKNPEGVELQSALKIGNELLLTEGKLLLNDFNITLTNTFTLINITEKAEIVFNGSGKIIVATEGPFAQNQDKNPRFFPNQFKFVHCESSQTIANISLYTFYLLPDSILEGAIQSVDPPPRLS